MRKILFTVLFYCVFATAAFPFDGSFIEICKTGTPEQVREAIEAGADVNMKDAEGQTPLMLAVNSNPSVVRLLLERGADVHAKTERGFTALMSALRGSANVENIHLLVEAGSDVNAESVRDNYGSYTPLGIAMDRNLGLRIFRILLENGADVGEATCNKEPLLMAAIKKFDSMGKDPADLLSLLIRFGADVDKTAGRNDPRTPLMLAAMIGNINVVRLLLENGANVNARVTQINIVTNTGNTALIMASIAQRDEIVRMLVSHGADVNAANSDGETALTLAVRLRAKARIIQTLIDCGINVNRKTVHGRTALMEAVLRYKNAEIVNILIDNGAIIDAETFNLAERFNPNKEILDALHEGYRQQRPRP